MTEVLSISVQSERSGFFETSPLRRSSSQSSLWSQSPTSYARTSANIKPKYTGPSSFDSRGSVSLPSSAPSSPRLAPSAFSSQPSYVSTPSSSLSLDEECSTDEDEDIIFPSYDDDDEEEEVFKGMQNWRRESDPPPSPTRVHSVEEATSPTGSGRPFAPLAYTNTSYPSAVAEDDTAVKREPTAHVDYLSHNWKEEDIWSSWRHVVAKRKVYSNSTRLENASWRSWAKSKYRLKTVPPDRLNWEKDHDVTWLYGPLQTGATTPLDADSALPASQLSRINSFASKKPILKKRSLSELMLQRSLMSSTLMKQATDALRAQQPERRVRDRPVLGTRALSDLVTSSNPGTPGLRPLKPSPPASVSTSPSGVQTPCTTRHIHFNNMVEQCIAINKVGDEREDDDGAMDPDSSDDDLLTMPSIPNAKFNFSNRSTPRNSFSSESKTIAMLPSTTLNYRGDTPDPAEQRAKQTGSFWNVASRISVSPSQETLKPGTPSANFLLDDEDDDVDLDWQPVAGRRNSIYVHDDDDPTEGPNGGMRRTLSGMFVPDEADDEGITATGLVGKVVDTVNTARDIAHVIWNVGWRR